MVLVDLNSFPITATPGYLPVAQRNQPIPATGPLHFLCSLGLDSAMCVSLDLSVNVLP